MIETHRTFIFVQFVERTIDAIVLGACLVLRQVGAADTGECASHQGFVFFSGRFALHFVLRLVVAVDHAVDALALA
jgi:hypothetical protein